MNKLKFLVAAFVVTMMTLGIYSCAKETDSQHKENLDLTAETRASGGDCFGAPVQGFDCTIIAEEVFSITLPQYPNCEFLVKVPTIKCYSGTGGSFFTIGNIISYTTSCQGVNQYFADYNLASNGGTLTTFLNKIAGQLYEAITLIIVNSQANINSSSATFTYYVSVCSKSCLVEVPRGEYSSYTHKYAKCGSLCCKRTDDWGKVNGVWKLLSSNISTVQDNNCATPQESCPLGTISSTSCYNTCSIFETF